MATKEFVNYYYVLGVSITASPEQIVHAYRRRSTGSTGSRNTSMQILEQTKLDDAYHILTHRYKKTVYDKLYVDELQRDEREKIADVFLRAIAKLDAWHSSLEGGSENSEADYGRIAGLREDQIDEECPWAPSLMSGEVAGFDGWLG